MVLAETALNFVRLLWQKLYCFVEGGELQIFGTDLNKTE